MKNCAQYIAEAKVALGDPRMSDRELGDRLGGYLQQNIYQSKRGVCPDTIAIALAKAIGLHPGEVLAVARAEREKNPEVRGFLTEWAKNASALLPSSPDVVMRGGIKAVRYSPHQMWRKRSVSIQAAPVKTRSISGSFHTPGAL